MASKVSLVAVLLLFFLCAANAQPGWRWCVPSKEEDGFCKSLVALFASLDNTTGPWSCVIGSDIADCLNKVSPKDGSTPTADVVVLDGSEIFDASVDYGMRPILREVLPDNSPDYYGIALIKKAFADSNPTLASLKGKASCHTGYRRMAGWLLPISNLTGSTPPIMEIVSRDSAVNNDLESVSRFFSTSCCPGKLMNESLCSGCKGDCNATGQYFDHIGAFKCLVDGGDVAFMKHTTPLKFAKGQPMAQTWPGLETIEGYRLLCPQGGNKPVTEAATCSFGAVPAQTACVRNTLSDADVLKFQSVMEKAANNSAVATILFKGANTDGYIFSTAAVGLAPVPLATSVRDYLGPVYGASELVRKLEKSGAVHLVARGFGIVTAVLATVILVALV